MMKCFSAFIGIIFASLLFAHASAEELIKSYDVTIDVSETGDIDVTEQIIVVVEGQDIRRGIFRDLPRYVIRDGLKVPERYVFQDVLRNGEPEPYVRSTEGHAVRLRIGDADRMLEHGEQAYTLKYRVIDQVRRGESFDEVYWNVTGNFWAFPILDASATIRLPMQARYQSYEVFTGQQGETRAAATMTRREGTYVFRTTSPLAENEGLSVSLKFNKGVIQSTQQGTQTYLWWVKNGALSLLSISFLLITGLYYRNWNKVGRDPAKHPVFARYKAPDNYSASASARIHDRGLKGQKALIATLMSLAIKGFIDLESEKTQTIITRTDAQKPKPKLDKEEAKLYALLFGIGSSDTIILNKMPNKRFYKANTKFRAHLLSRYGRDYYRLNAGYIVLGIVLSVIAFIMSITQFYGFNGMLFWGTAIGLVWVNALFIYLMPAATKKGQATRAEVQGLKLYLETAEKQRFDAVDVHSEAPPPMSIKHYEAMLPYAIALGVEAPWTKYFESVMPLEAETYNPAWQSAANGAGRSLSGLTDQMVSNISSGVSSAAPQSSGTSSSGGGGFSGGGGGGGGGGGW